MANTKTRGYAKPQTKPEERGEVVERICLLYESQHATLESCCQAVGITSRTFHLWIGENSQFSARYKKAKERADEFYWEAVIAPKAKTALETLLERNTRAEKKSERGENATGSFSKDTDAEIEVLPNVTAAIFALKGLYPDKFADRSKVDQTTQVSHTLNLDGLTTEEKRQMAALWEKAKSE